VHFPTEESNLKHVGGGSVQQSTFAGIKGNSTAVVVDVFTPAREMEYMAVSTCRPKCHNRRLPVVVTLPQRLQIAPPCV
jgi:hypothetical protein